MTHNDKRDSYALDMAIEALEREKENEAEIARLRDALKKLGGGEAFTSSFKANQNKEWKELLAMKAYARKALERAGGE